jgi:hypothetical protein
MSQHVPTSYPEKQPPRPASWGQTATLIGGIIMGIIGLAWFALYVDKRARGPDPGEPHSVTVRFDMVAIWLHPQIFELLNDPTADDALRFYEAFYAYVEKHKLERTWCVVIIRHVQSSRPSPVMAVIRQPHDDPSLYPDPLVVLNAANGRPPHVPLVDYSKMKVGIIPAEFVDAEGEGRRRRAEQLRSLEPRPLPVRGAGAANRKDG